MKKMFIIGIIIVIFIYTVFILIRFNIVNKICELNEENMSKNNYCVEYENKEVKGAYLKKDNILKSKRMYCSRDKDFFYFYYDTNTNEKYFYNDNNKVYKNTDEAEDEAILDLNIYLVIPAKNKIERLLYAMNPNNIIKTIDYNGSKCYRVINKGNKEEEYIEKDTGLCLYWKGLSLTKYADVELSLTYEFGTVTDSDISHPDFSTYSYSQY